MKIVTVIGARPQYIKAAVLSPALRAFAQEVLIDTGQHYDESLSRVFYEDLQLPPPDYHLHVGSASHGIQTANMLAALDPILQEERPDWVIVYGDTNSTLAGALAASKLTIPVAHIEAGLRSFNRQMPEEINRIVADHLASRLYCPTEQAVANLAREGITRGVRLSGDLMDVLIDKTPDDPGVLSRLGLSPGQYALATVHRAQTTDDKESLEGVLQALSDLPWRVVLPLHPRTRDRIAQFGLESWLTHERIHVLDPVGYREMVTLERHAQAVLTDSGGVQREACRLGVPTYILRNETEWTELVEKGQAILSGVRYDEIMAAIRRASFVRPMRREVFDPVDCIVKDLQRRS